MATVLRSYGDESGIHDGARFCVVAGLCGSPGQWKLFEKEWKAALGGVPYFHSKEFFQRKNTALSSKSPYRGWDSGRANAFISGLLEVIRKRRIWPVGATVVIPDFMALTYGERCWLTGATFANGPQGARFVTHGSPDVPWHVGFSGLIADAHGISRTARLHFIFEVQREYGPYAMAAYERNKREVASNQLGNLIFADRIQEVALQAADLVSHEIFNTYERNGRINREHRVIMEMLLRKRSAMQFCDAAYFDWLLSTLNDPDARAWLQSTPDPARTR